VSLVAGTPAGLDRPDSARVAGPARPRLTRRLASWVHARGWGLPLVMGPLLLFLLTMLILPLGSIVLMSLYARGEAGVIVRTVSLQNYAEFLTTPVYLRILLVSMVVGAVVALVSLVVAYLPACVLALNRAGARNLLLLLLIVPFWTSFLIRTYAWIIVLGTQGVVNGMLKQAGMLETSLGLLFNRGAVVLGLTHALLPFAIVPIYASVERIDDALLEAAASLGARPWAVFAEVIVPMSVPGIIAAGVLVFIEAMGAFITPQLLGGPADTMIAMLVQQRFLASYDWPLGSAVAVIYLVFTGLLMYASTVVRSLLARRTVGIST
jgi:spermidine/putrescine transport system permease protein